MKTVQGIAELNTNKSVLSGNRGALPNTLLVYPLPRKIQTKIIALREIYSVDRKSGLNFNLIFDDI